MGKVLLIQYDKKIRFEVIKDYKREKDRYRYMCGLPISGQDYNSYNRTLNVYGEFNLTDTSKIIFWEHEPMDISLPFQYSDIVLDALINDSTIQFTYLNQKHILRVGQVFNDSIISFEQEGKRLIKYTIAYQVHNYGLTYKKNIIDDKERIKRRYKENRIQDSLDMFDLNQLEINRKK